MLFQAAPKLLNAPAHVRGGQFDRRHPLRRGQRHVEHGGHRGGHLVGAVAVGLVDHVEVGNLHHTSLESLDGIPGFGNQGDDNRVGHAHDAQFGLAHADGLDNYHVVTRGVQRPGDALDDAGQPSGLAAGGDAADENAGVQVVSLHPDAVAKQGAATERAGGVNSHDTHPLVESAQQAGQLVNDGALASAGGAGNADGIGAACTGVHVTHHVCRSRVATFQHGYDAGEGALLSGQKPVGQLRQSRLTPRGPARYG